MWWIMATRDILKKVTPGELLSMLTKRDPTINPEKTLEQLSIAELLILELDDEELSNYKTKRLKKLSTDCTVEDSELQDDASVADIIQELYRRRI